MDQDKNKAENNEQNNSTKDNDSKKKFAINFNSSKSQFYSSIGTEFPLSQGQRLRYFKRLIHYYSEVLITKKEIKKRNRIWGAYFWGITWWAFAFAYIYRNAKSNNFIAGLIVKNKILGNGFLFSPILATGIFYYYQMKYDKSLLEKYLGGTTDEELVEMEFKLNPALKKVYGANLTRMQLKKGG